jgi:uncharacterized membrane protein YvbJ
MFCKNCGEKITNKASFCKNCGISITNRRKLYWNKKKKIFFDIIIIIILFLGSGSFLSLLFDSYYDEGPITFTAIAITFVIIFSWKNIIKKFIEIYETKNKG